MRPSLEEQEATISFGRLDKTAKVYASDTRYINKLDKLTESSPDWKCTGQETSEGDVVGKFYECPVKFISFRGKQKESRPMTEEQKAKAAEIFRQWRESQRQK